MVQEGYRSVRVTGVGGTGRLEVSTGYWSGWYRKAIGQYSLVQSFGQEGGKATAMHTHNSIHWKI